VGWFEGREDRERKNSRLFLETAGLLAGLLFGFAATSIIDTAITHMAFIAKKA
jgi:hypothetical protein